MSKRPNSGKRRSTFGRRRSRSLGGLATHEICKTIDKNLPPADRLQLLIQYAIETAFSKAKEEITDEIDDFEFSKSIAAAQVEIESEIESLDLYNLAVSKDKNTEAGVSQHVKIAQHNAVMAKLEEEKKQWDAALAKEREELEKEVNLRKIELEGTLDRTKYNLHDYSNLLENISYMSSNITYQVSRMKAARDKIIYSVDVAESAVAAMSTKIDSYFETKCEESPKSLIKGCFSEESNEA